MPKQLLSHNDKEQLLASALKIERYAIEDIFDKTVVYRNNAETPTAYYQADYSIDSDGKVTLGQPVKVMRKTTYEPMVKPAMFSVDGSPTPDGGMVLRSGKLFEAGDYPDKNFTLTEEELGEAVAAFTPVGNNLDHTRTLLDGNLGEIRSVEQRGKELFGTVAIPKWLHDLKGSDPISVSLEWARDTKRIIGNALTINPRVTDAQLVAAFNAANTPPKKEQKAMTLLEKLKAMFSGDKEPTEDELKAAITEEKPPVETPKPDEKPADQKPIDKPADEKPAGFADEGLRRRLLQSDAEVWFNSELEAGHVFPSQKESLVAAFTKAALADNAGVACFNDAGVLNEGEGVKALKAAIAAYPKHNLTTEQIGGGIEGLVLLSAGVKQGEISPARQAELDSAYGIKRK